MSPSGVLLDLDNTLYDYEAAHKPALETSVHWLAERLAISDDTVLSAYKEARKQINTELHGHGASHSRFLYFQRVNEILGRNPCRTVLEAEDVYWTTYLEHMHLRPHAIDFLDSISSLPIAIVTDLTARIQFQKLKKLNLQDRFAAVVSSEEAGAEKPDPRMFALALKKIDRNPKDCFLVGDNWQKDIVGATSLGIRSFWLKEPGARSAENVELAHEFESFEQLIELVKTFDF